MIKQNHVDELSELWKRTNFSQLKQRKLIHFFSYVYTLVDRLPVLCLKRNTHFQACYVYYSIQFVSQSHYVP